MESFVKNVLFYFIFSTLVNFKEWSDEPVATISLLNQHTEFIASLCKFSEAMKGKFFLFVFFFFFF